MIGQTISHYTILEKLGEGGMGVVYKARDMKLDRTVALKFFPPHLEATAEDKARFLQEAKAASALNHPNVCAIYDIKDVEGQTFIVMEYVDGKTLRDAKREIGVKQSVDIIAQVADALASAHEKGIVHRDIKADNIMIRSDGRATIMDFGLAKLPGFSMLTKAGSTVGTTAYMSPEQAQGLETDHRTDVFSLGVVLYELLSRQLPFKGAHEAAVMYEVINVDPQPPSTINPDVESELDRIVLKCLEKDLNHRYQSAREVAVDLRRFKRDTAGQRVGTTTVTAPQSKGVKILPLKIGVFVALALILAVIGWYFFGGRGETLDSLAVLPFENVSNDPNMEYLSDGITESLINSLSQIPKLKVMSRNSVFNFKGKTGDPQSIGLKLGVRAALVGRVQERGENLLISAELIDVSDNAHLWGEQYNRPSADIITVQEEITKEISRNLGLRLSDKENTSQTRRPTESTDAYQLYLKGRYYWNKRSAEGLKKSIDYFQQAVGVDPNYALAYSGMADAYNVLGWFEYGTVAPSDVYPKAKAAAMEAVKIDPQLAEAYASLAFVNMGYDHDWAAVEQNYHRSFKLNPSYPSAHQWYAEYLIGQGKIEESIREMRFALSLDPLSLIITRDLGWMFYFARRYDSANEYFRKALELDPNFARGHLILGQSYLQQGLAENAIAEFETASRLAGGPVSTIMLGCAYVKAGRRQEALKILDNLLRLSATRYVPPAGISMFYAALGDRDKAFEWLNRAVDEHSGIFVFIKVDPLFDPLRNDPRFPILLKRVGFTP